MTNQKAKLMVQGQLMIRQLLFAMATTKSSLRAESYLRAAEAVRHDTAETLGYELEHDLSKMLELVDSEHAPMFRDAIERHKIIA